MKKYIIQKFQASTKKRKQNNKEHELLPMAQPKENRGFSMQTLFSERSGLVLHRSALRGRKCCS